MSNFFCSLLSLGCPSHGHAAVNAAPEISGDAVVAMLVLVCGGVLILLDWGRVK